MTVSKLLTFCRRWNRLLHVVSIVFVAIGAVFLVSHSVFAEHPQAATHVVHHKALAWAFISAALATGMSTVAAGFAVASVGSAALGAVSEKPELMGKSIIYVGLAEGIGIYGLIVSIMILFKI